MGGGCARAVGVQEPSKVIQEDLLSVGSLRSRLTVKKRDNISYYLVEDVRRLEKDSEQTRKRWKAVLAGQKLLPEQPFYSLFSKKTDAKLLSFKEQKLEAFQKLVEQGIPLNLRWNVWKVLLFNSQIFDEKLYKSLLHQKVDDNYETAILKDLPRTYPTHLFFKQTEHQLELKKKSSIIEVIDLNPGQKQLYNVLSALSVHMPNVGYTQGMNFIVGFLLLMSGGNESDTFWVFTLLARDSEFLFMGMFEESLPLMHVFIAIFEKKFLLVLPKLYAHFQENLLDSMMWVWKWIITVFLYSFPMEIVAKLWDYLLVNKGCSIISLSLAIAAYYEKDFIQCDTEDFHHLLDQMKESRILLDRSSKYFLDFTKLMRLAKNFEISKQFAREAVEEMIAINEKRQSIYTDFFIMRDKNSAVASSWIQDSFKERVKLSPQEAQLHRGATGQSLDGRQQAAAAVINPKEEFNSNEDLLGGDN